MEDVTHVKLPWWDHLCASVCDEPSLFESEIEYASDRRSRSRERVFLGAFCSAVEIDEEHCSSQRPRNAAMAVADNYQITGINLELTNQFLDSSSCLVESTEQHRFHVQPVLCHQW